MEELRELARSRDGKFWKKVKEDNNGCWNWCGYIRSSKHQRFWHRSVTYNGVKMSPRQKAYLLLTGKPATHALMAKCGNKDCINPKHMVLTAKLLTPRDVTLNDNSRVVM